MPQLDYSYAPPSGISGQITHMGTRELQSRVNKSGSVLVYGRGIKLLTDDAIANLSASTDIFGGVVVRVYQYEDLFDAAGNAGYGIDRDATFLTKGKVAVEVEEAVSETDLVFCRFAVNGVGKDIVGKFRNDADTNTCIAVPSARWYKGTTSAGIAILDLNLP
jgi:hypothetical protein